MADYLISDRAIELLRAAHDKAKDYTATIERLTAGGGTDPLGQPLPGVYEIFATLPCAWVPAKGATERRTAEADYYSKRPEIHIAPGSGVQLNDRVTSIKDRAGNEIEAGAEAFNIIEIRPGRIYTALVLEKFGG